MANKNPILVYEKEISFTLDNHKNCEGGGVIQNKKYFVKKYDLKQVKARYAHDYAFVVFLSQGEDLDTKMPTYKSILFGDKGGECDSAQTDPNYQSCGLSTQLMIHCLRDKDITIDGGVNPDTEEQFKNNPDAQKLAKKQCMTIVSLNQGANPPRAGVAYTKAATKAGFEKVFTVTPGGNNMAFWSVAVVEKEYLNNPIQFIIEHGQQWFFCDKDL